MIFLWKACSKIVFFSAWNFGSNLNLHLEFPNLKPVLKIFFVCWWYQPLICLIRGSKLKVEEGNRRCPVVNGSVFSFSYSESVWWRFHTKNLAPSKLNFWACWLTKCNISSTIPFSHQQVGRTTVCCLKT